MFSLILLGSKFSESFILGKDNQCVKWKTPSLDVKDAYLRISYVFLKHSLMRFAMKIT